MSRTSGGICERCASAAAPCRPAECAGSLVPGTGSLRLRREDILPGSCGSSGSSCRGSQAKKDYFLFLRIHAVLLKSIVKFLLCYFSENYGAAAADAPSESYGAAAAEDAPSETYGAAAADAAPSDSYGAASEDAPLSSYGAAAPTTAAPAPAAAPANNYGAAEEEDEEEEGEEDYGDQAADPVAPPPASYGAAAAADSAQPSYNNNELDAAASDAADSGNGLKMLMNAVPGVPGEDYPIFAEAPETAFACEGKVDGGKDSLSFCFYIFPLKHSNPHV